MHILKYSTINCADKEWFYKGDKSGISTILMEAMATGLPVISTYHSAIPKLIDNGINGFLVNEKDIESYSEKMYEILFVVNKFSSNARKKVSERFNLTKEVSHIMDIYKNLIDFNNKTWIKNLEVGNWINEISKFSS